jgi:hypothetical protein
MHPFLDVSKLTDEEIIEKLGKAYTYLNNQTALGHTPTVHSILEVIKSLEGEKYTRMSKISDDESRKKNIYANTSLDIGKLED